MLTPYTQLSPLRRARLARGFTLRELARQTGINAGKISAAERGCATLSRAEQRGLVRVLGIQDPGQVFA
jgi:transcriptional regulator with XRE-family HTH domain